MTKEMCLKDRDGERGKLKIPLIKFGTKLERNYSRSTAGHFRPVGGN